MPRLLVENVPFKFVKKTVVNESNAKSELPTTVYEYVKLGNGQTFLKVEGIVADYTEVNGNNRLYAKNVWEHVLKSNDHIMKDIAEHNAWGVREHPESGETKIQEASHRILSLRDDNEGHIIAEVLIIDEHLRKMIESGGTVGISSRGWGDTVTKNGREEVLEGYVCETFDFVKVNSVRKARFNTTVNSVTKSEATKSNESKIAEKNSDLVESAVLAKSEDSTETVNSTSDSCKFVPLKENKVMSSNFDLELASLKVIAESTSLDNDQVSVVKATALTSVEKIQEALEKKEIKGEAAARLIKKYNEIVEAVTKNAPDARAVTSLTESNKNLNKRYKALSAISEGIISRYRALSENYKKLGAVSKPMAEADVKTSKRYQALLDITEELLARQKESEKTIRQVIKESVTKTKDKIVATKLTPVTEALALAEKKLAALSTEGLSEKAVSLIRKCDSVKRVDMVLEKVKGLKASNSVVESKTGTAKVAVVKAPAKTKVAKVESQAHVEPLPGDKITEAKVSEEGNVLHESISLISRTRKLRK